MTAPNGNVYPSKFWFAFLAVVLLAGIAVVLVEPFQAVKGNTAVVTYTRGLLNVTIPYHSPYSGDGKLTVEVLDPEDKVLGRAETQAAITKGDGRWRQKIRLENFLAVEDLVWHRVRYRYVYHARGPQRSKARSPSPRFFALP
jgi:hypothetical protein